jgi:hypothetical protein
MRYVIVIAAIAFFVIWDGLYNEGRYLDYSVREMKTVVDYINCRTPFRSGHGRKRSSRYPKMRGDSRKDHSLSIRYSAATIDRRAIVLRAGATSCRLTRRDG